MVVNETFLLGMVFGCGFVVCLTVLAILFLDWLE
jgi:hypothetical protein